MKAEHTLLQLPETSKHLCVWLQEENKNKRIAPPKYPIILFHSPLLCHCSGPKEENKKNYFGEKLTAKINPLFSGFSIKGNFPDPHVAAGPFDLDSGPPA